MPFTIRCARHGCENTYQVRTLRDLDQAPRVWVCPICEDFDTQDAINALDRRFNPHMTQEHMTHEG